ncbi:MAG TPA: hypothetical protein VIM07_04410 [Chitinophagaceae bacterium]
MIDVRNIFVGGLDLDNSYHVVGKTAYIDALNITRDQIDGSHDNEISNIVGNQKVNYSYPSAGVVIGAYPFSLRNVIYFFRYSATGYNGVYEYNRTSGVITKIFESLVDSATDILNFTEHNKITSVNIYPSDTGDLLFFLDSLGRPTEMNITRFKNGEYTPVTRSIIDVIKIPPLVPPTSVYYGDITRRTNSTRNKLFRFKERWHYDDNETSCPSPISKVPYPINVLDDTYTSVITNNNVILLNVSSGAKNVKAVEILMSYVDKTNTWSDFASVEIVNKADNGWGDNNTFPYAFYNDSTYPFINLKESIQLYDYVPDYANCQDLANGNVPVYFGIKEGLSRIITPNVVNTILTVAAGAGGSVGNLDGIISKNVSGGGNPPFNTHWEMDYTFSGIPAVGTLVTIKVRRKSDGFEFFATSYTTISGDTADTVSLQLIANNTAPDINVSHPNAYIIELAIKKSVYEPLPLNGFYSLLTITPPGTSLAPNSIPAWLWSTQRNIGLEYFNTQGKTNGVLYNAKVSFPAYAENGSHIPLLPYINVKIYHLPPIWATSFQFVFTAESTIPFFWVTADVNTTESAYIYFDITNLPLNQKKFPSTNQVVSYTAQDGDRLRLIRRMNDNTVFADTYDAAVEGLVVEPIINGVAQTGKQFIKIKKIAPFSSVDYTTKNFVIEVYRQGQQVPNTENAPFFELGRQYPTILDSIGVLVHGGEVTNQDTVGNIPAEFNLYDGDCYFRSRTAVLSETGTSTFNVMDRNFVDFYISAVSSLQGRASLIDINAKPSYFGAYGRFGQAYQPNTNINGLCRFFQDNDYDKCDISNGDMMLIKVRDRFIRTFQKLKVGRIPLFSEIKKDATGNNILFDTDKLLNPIQYDVGDFGIGENSESLASHDYADWFTTNIKGAVCRVSDNGVDNVSKLYNVDSWATENLPLRTGNSKVYGAFDQRKGSYIIAVEASGDSPAQTINFSSHNQNDSSFESFLSFHPEMMCCLGVLLVSFKNGDLYTHDSTIYNRFYGIDYPSYITFVFNEYPLQRKSFQSVEEISNTVWGCPEIITSLNTYGTVSQQSNLVEAEFTQLEGGYCSSFKRDTNSPGGKINGQSLKGFYTTIKFQKNTADSLITLALCKVYFINSPLNTQ